MEEAVREVAVVGGEEHATRREVEPADRVHARADRREDVAMHRGRPSGSLIVATTPRGLWSTM